MALKPIRHHVFRQSLILFVGLMLAPILVGCETEEQIETYLVPKQLPNLFVESPDAGPSEEVDMTRDRMLAAMVPHEGQAWFFKVAGLNDAVQDQMDAFLSVVKSLKFSDDGEPSWTLPDGWEQEPGSQFRFATLKIPSDDKPLELSVIPLPADDVDSIEYILSNVNRWRGQLQLKPIGADELFNKENRSEETIQFELEDGTKVTLANLVGNLGGKEKSRPPFASGGQFGPASPPLSKGSSGITFGTPDGWSISKGTSMSVEAFEVTADGKRVEFTATPLGIVAATLLPNVNRWRNQIQMPGTTQAALENDLKSIKVGGSEGKLVELHGPSGKSTLGVIVVHGDSAWFFKLTGDSDLAKRETQNFKAFVQSVKFQD